MIFHQIDASAPHYVIDGIKYDLTSVAVIDTFKYKGYLVEIYDYMENEHSFENFQSWQKDLMKILKTWDQAYCKHIKAPHPEM